MNLNANIAHGLGNTRRAALLTGIAMSLLALLLFAGFGRPIGQTAAQDGTPPAGLDAVDATFEYLAAGLVSELPATPASMQLARVRIEPGGHIAVPAEDPGLVLIWVEAGTMTATSSSDTDVLRAAMLAEQATQPFESFAAGEEFTVGPGDSFIGLPNAGGNFRNDGSEEVVLWIAGLSPEPAQAG